MANPIARMSEFRRQKAGKKIGRPVATQVAMEPRPDSRLIRLHAGHASVDLMAFMISWLCATVKKDVNA